MEIELNDLPHDTLVKLLIHEKQVNDLLIESNNTLLGKLDYLTTDQNPRDISRRWSMAIEELHAKSTVEVSNIIAGRASGEPSN